MLSKYNNLSIHHVTNDIIDIYSYYTYIIEYRGDTIHLNTAYFNYSNTTSRHYTKSLGKIIGSNSNLSKILSCYNKIKHYLKCNPYNRPSVGNPSMLQFQLKHYIESLGYDYKVDSVDKIWVVISL